MGRDFGLGEWDFSPDWKGAERCGQMLCILTAMEAKAGTLKSGLPRGLLRKDSGCFCLNRAFFLCQAATWGRSWRNLQKK